MEELAAAALRQKGDAEHGRRLFFAKRRRK
jgi:hypothetical protein